MKLETHRSFPSELQSLVAAANAQRSASHAVERMWAHDYRLWKPDPTDITNRLGWLTIIEYMKDRTEELRTFGLFLQLVDAMIPDLSSPGKPFAFRTLAQAQAAGDIQALHAHAQQAIRLPLGENPIETIQALTKSLAPRMPARRPTRRRTKGRGIRKK